MKKLLICGGTGFIGRNLAEHYAQAKKYEVYATYFSSAPPSLDGVTFVHADLTNKEDVKRVVQGMDIIIQAAATTSGANDIVNKPYYHVTDNAVMNSLILREAFPSKNDWFAGWAKRMGELQIEAYKIQYGWNNLTIVRPANVYGSFDNFSPDDAMVIPSLIRRAVDGENPLVVWGDGSPIRDFIHARDVASGMLLVMDKMPEKPVNLGSGTGVTIKEIAESVCKCVFDDPEALIWDTSKPSGDKKRLMDISYANSLGFAPEISIEDGIRETVNWYRENRDIVGKRYNVFLEDK